MLHKAKYQLQILPLCKRMSLGPTKVFLENSNGNWMHPRALSVTMPGVQETPRTKIRSNMGMAKGINGDQCQQLVLQINGCLQLARLIRLSVFWSGKLSHGNHFKIMATIYSNAKSAHNCQKVSSSYKITKAKRSDPQEAETQEKRNMLKRRNSEEA